MLAGALLATLITSARSTTSTSCPSGTIKISGSSAFGPIAQRILAKYSAQCPGITVNSEFGGSIHGIDVLSQDPNATSGVAVLSDGAASVPTPRLARQQVAVVVYSVVVNKQVGIDNLSLDQLRAIYLGHVTDWNQLGGPNLPIRIVGRDGGSGTRQVFERQVLGGSEGELSSDDCLTRDRNADRPTTRCEVGTTEQLIGKVATTAGAIGYADVANDTTKSAVRAGDLVPVKLDGRYPDTSTLPDYPFWTVEYLYTGQSLDSGTPLRGFVDFLGSDSAHAVLSDAGYPPCLDKAGVLNHLCTLR
jgi:ABC-type phosphate transport system substrate-binding protein